MTIKRQQLLEDNVEKLWNKVFRKWQGNYKFNHEWNRSLSWNWSRFWNQHQYERKVCKKGSFRLITHLLLVSGRGNDSLQWEPIGHFSSSPAAWNVNTTTAAHPESPGLWRDVLLLQLWTRSACTWETLNGGFPAPTASTTEPKTLSVTWVSVSVSGSENQEWLVCAATNAQLK